MIRFPNGSKVAVGDWAHGRPPIAEFSDGAVSLTADGCGLGLSLLVSRGGEALEVTLDSLADVDRLIEVATHARTLMAEVEE